MTDQFFTIVHEIYAREALPVVNILPQQRSSLTHIDELRNSIRSNGGLINPINLLAFATKQEAIAHARFFRKMYGDKKRSPLAQASDGKYYFLVAGHRRYSALAKIPSEEVAHVSVGMLIPPEGSKEVSLQAAFFQARENMQVPPSPLDKAHSIVAMRNAMRAARGGRRVTANEVVSESGQSISSVSDALRYYDLPEYLRRKTANGEISYGRVLIIGRLFFAQHKGKAIVKRGEIEFLLKSTILQKTPEPVLIDRVNEIIRLRRDELLGQDLFSQGYGLSEIIKVESRSAISNQAKQWMSLNAQISAFISAVHKDSTLLESELGGIFGVDPLKTLVLSNANLLEELTRLLRAKRLLAEIPSARVRKAAGGVRIAVVVAKS
jgi:hypothetical protein